MTDHVVVVILSALTFGALGCMHLNNLVEAHRQQRELKAILDRHLACWYALRDELLDRQRQGLEDGEEEEVPRWN